jgi:hypothetical protein
MYRRQRFSRKGYWQNTIDGEMRKWTNVQEDGCVKNAIIAVINHYAGFEPGTMNILRIMLGLPEAKWENKEDEVSGDSTRD